MRLPGTITLLPSGKFRLRMRVNRRRETIGTFDTRGEAERARDSHLLVLAETAADYEGLTIAEHANAVISRRDVRKMVRDPESERSRYEEHIKKDVLGRVALRAAQSRHVFAWLRRLEDKGLSAQTRRNCLSLLRVVFRDAHEMGHVKANPCIGVRVAGKDKDAWTYLTREELPRVLAACDEGVTRHIVAVEIGTGMRPGELVTLRRSDVFLDDRPRIIVRYGAAPDVPTKTGAVRTVHLFGLALIAMQSWMAMPPPKDNPHDLVFPRLRGGFRDEDHVIPWAEWKGILTRAGMTGRRFRWYDFRHTCASWLVSGWWGRRWSLQEVKEMLGHTSITITQRYAHLAGSASEEAARATSGGGLAGLVGSGGAGSGLGHALLLTPVTPPPPPSSNPGKMAAALLAPPTRVERATNGLGIHGIARSGAEIAMDDPRVTRPPEDGSDDPPAPSDTHRRWVLEATANLYELLARKGGPCAA